jgi:hypothetical protein
LNVGSPVTENFVYRRVNASPHLKEGQERKHAEREAQD